MILEYSYRVGYGYKTDVLLTNFHYEFETDYKKFVENHVDNMYDDLLEFHIDIYEASTIDNEPLGRKLGVCKVKMNLELEFDSRNEYEPKLEFGTCDTNFDFEEEEFKNYFYDKNGNLYDWIVDDMDNYFYALFRVFYHELVVDATDCYWECHD